MSQICIDGKAAPLSLAPEVDLASAFEATRDHVLASGRVVTSIRVGVQEVGWRDGSSCWDQTLSTVGPLLLTTDWPINLSRPVLSNLVDSLKVFAADQRSLAKRIRTEKERAGEAIIELLGRWPEFRLIIDQVCMLHGIQKNDPVWKDMNQQFEEQFTRLSRAFGELKETLELNDYILAADLIEYDLSPLAEDFVRSATRLWSLLEERSNGAAP